MAWIIVQDDTDAEHDYTYDHKPMWAGPFDSYEEAHAHLGGYDDDVIILER